MKSHPKDLRGQFLSLGVFLYVMEMILIPDKDVEGINEVMYVRMPTYHRTSDGRKS